MSWHSFDVFNNATGDVVARNVTSAEAALALGITAAEVEYGVTSRSYVDAGGHRCVCHMQIGGG
jgi:hypothetical protein